jgi:regulation of enolase protein 1 (concanavalin A-like superfamily)
MNTINRLFRLMIILVTASGTSMISLAQKPIPKNTDETAVSYSELIFTDIGKPNISGSKIIYKDEISIVAGGADIWGKHDEFYFGYKKINGDFDLKIKIISLTASHKYTKAGIMARTDLTDSSQHVYYQVFPDNSARNKNNGGCEFQYRLESGSDMKAVYPDPQTSGNQFNVAFPDTWIRLKRRGEVFESYLSNDGKTWNLYTTYTLKMPVELFVGLAVTSHNKTDFTLARFGPVLLSKQ